MKMTQITTLALLGLAATAFVDAAAAKPGNGRGQGNCLMAEATTDVAVEDGVDAGRGRRCTRGSSAAEEQTNYLPMAPENQYGQAGGRTPVLCLPVFNARLSGVMGCLPAYNARLSGVMDCLPACVGNAPST